MNRLIESGWHGPRVASQPGLDDTARMSWSNWRPAGGALSPPAIEVIDTVGAGDASLAGLLASLMLHPGRATGEHLARAVAAGAAACMVAGAARVTQEQVESLARCIEVTAARGCQPGSLQTVQTRALNQAMMPTMSIDYPSNLNPPS